MLEHFWGHHVRGSHNRVPPCDGVRYLSADSKIRNLDLCVISQQHIGTLDVSMDFAGGVKILQALQQLSHHDRYVGLLQNKALSRELPNKILERASATELHNDE